MYNRKSSQPEWKHWLKVARSHNRTQTKVADFGGKGDSASFEQAFSNLAHAYLRDSAPKLLDHEIGFQLLDRDHENTKAVGVFAFKVGSNWLYAPVFFINGDLKGHELLYIKNQDMFVPLKENWINYLVNRKPNILGSSVDRNTSSLGQRQPDFTQLSRSPAKFGSARPVMHEKNAYETGGSTLDYDKKNLELYAGTNKYPYGEKRLPWFASELEPELIKAIRYETEPELNSYGAHLSVPLEQAKKHKILQQYIASATKDHEYRQKWRADFDNANKTATAQPTLKQMMTAAMPTIAKCATMNTRAAFEDMGKALDLKKFLKEARLTTIEMLVKSFQDAPALAKAFDEFHGLDVIKEAIAVAKERESRPKIASVLSEAPEKSPAVAGLKIISYSTTVQTKLPPETTEEDQEKLLRDGVLILDQRDRDNVSVPYHVQVEKKLTNPTCSGLYDVLVKPGNIERCYIAMFPMGPSKRSDFVTVVRTEGKPEWINTRADQVFVLSCADQKEFDEWFNALPEANSLPSGGRYMLIGKNGDATVPVRMVREYGESEFGTTSYEVHMEDHSKFPPKGHISPCCYTDPLNYDKYRDGQRLHINGKKGSNLRVSMGDVFVPEGFKLLKCAPGEDDVPQSELKDAGPGACGCGESDMPPLMPGNLADAQLEILNKTAALEVYHNGTEVVINKEAARSPIKALVTLVEHHGLREDAAREILKTAAAKRKYSGRIKYAAPYGAPMMINDAPNAPTDPGPVMGGETIMGADVPTQMGIDIGMPVADMSAAQTDRQIYNPNTRLDRRDVNQVLQAAQSGQKEVFDTAMIGSMLRAVRDDSLVDRYMGELTTGLDKLGRILFMFYWHGDRFADRYGKADMPELEDSLRNAFEMLGDVILFLKQKTIEPYPEEAGADVDLSNVANA